MSTPWIPNADVLMLATGELLIRVELACLSREDLEINLEGQRFVITGQRFDRDENGAKFYVKELQHGPFQCVVEVPEAFDVAGAKANYQNGLLRVIVPPLPPSELERRRFSLG